MNFIITIILFLTISLSSYFGYVSIPQDSGFSQVFLALSVISGIVTLISIIIFVFAQMGFVSDFNRHVNSYYSYKRRIRDKEKSLIRYKEELEKILTNNYSDYEKEVFKNMAPTDNESLVALMIKYPELKFNGVLTEYTNGLKNIINSVTNLEDDLTYEITAINNLMANKWSIIKFIAPEDVN